MIVCDTGVLVAAADNRDDDHRACVDLLTGLRLDRRRLLVPGTVLAETGYMLQEHIGPHAEVAFLKALTDGDFSYVELETTDLARAAELVEIYDDLPLGITDATVIALCESLGLTEVATLDTKHFTVVRPNHTTHLTLLP